MNLQIDIKPAYSNGDLHQLNLYVDGYCYPMFIQADYVAMMQRKGLIKKVKGRRREGEKIIEFEYSEGVDSAGVQFTSQEYNLKENKLKK